MWKGKGWYWVWDGDEYESDAIITYLVEYDESSCCPYEAKTMGGSGWSYDNARPLTDTELNELASDPRQMSLGLTNQS